MTWRPEGNRVSIMLLNEKECSSQAASPTYETNKQIMKKETIWLFKDNLHICLASALSYISFLKNSFQIYSSHLPLSMEHPFY